MGHNLVRQVTEGHTRYGAKLSQQQYSICSPKGALGLTSLAEQTGVQKRKGYITSVPWRHLYAILLESHRAMQHSIV